MSRKGIARSDSAPAATAHGLTQDSQNKVSPPSPEAFTPPTSPLKEQKEEEKEKQVFLDVDAKELNDLITEERDFFVGTQLRPRWYILNWSVFPIATCYPGEYISFRERRVLTIPRFLQKGRQTFASIQQEVATIQAHESQGWLYVGEAAFERECIMRRYNSLLRALRDRITLGFDKDFWGYRYYTFGLNDSADEDKE